MGGREERIHYTPCSQRTNAFHSGIEKYTLEREVESYDAGTEAFSDERKRGRERK